MSGDIQENKKRIRQFWSKVSKKSNVFSSNPDCVGECWIMNNSLDKNGYARFGSVRAHRFAFELEKGPISTGNEIHHNCWNKNCVRPEHLEQMTHGENMRQPDHFIGQQLLAKFCPRGHWYGGWNLYDRRDSNKRDCVICRTITGRKGNQGKSANVTLWPSKINFDILRPRGDQILIGDICHALSNICRYTGHIRYFYSILQHSMQVALWIKHLGGSKIQQFNGLLHDGSEFVCNDLSSPLKKNLKVYQQIEDLVQMVIANKFDLPYPFPDIVHEADILARKFEANVLKDGEFDVEVPEFILTHVSSPAFAGVASSDSLRDEFLRLFYELGGGING